MNEVIVEMKPVAATRSVAVVGREGSKPAQRLEARAELVSMAKGSFGALDPELLADHVLALDDRAEWPVLAEAMEALKRRWTFGRRDGLRIENSPAGRVLGAYTTRARGGTTRPYRSVLERMRPLRGSCGCADFGRASLGLCKHLLVVLDALARRPRAWRRGFAEPAPVTGARLEWDPVRPSHGADDWLARVRLVRGGVPFSRLPGVKRRFTRADSDTWLPRHTLASEPRRRLVLVRELKRYARGGDPALEARLLDEEAELAREVRLAASAPRMRNHVGALRRKLYPYQRAGVERFLARGRLVLADDMGLGKTVQAIAACHALAGVRLVRRGLLIVPAPLKHQWLREWQATGSARIEIVDGSRDERARIYARTSHGFLIANYEQLLRDLDLIQSWEPEFVVLDEAQRIKNWEARTSHCVKSLRPEYRLVLTGTPMENRLDELASIVEWVDGHALEPKWRLVPFHAVRADGERATIGVQHLDTLRARLAPCLLRRVRSEVLGQLPGRTDTPIPIDLTPAQIEAHEDLVPAIAKLAAIAQRRPLTQQEFLKLMQLLATQRQICNGLALIDFAEVWPSIARRKPTPRLLATLEAPKLAELRALVQSLAVDQGRRIVVFSQWRRMLELAAWAVSDVLAESRLRAVFFTGKEGQKRRTQNIIDFHDQPDVRVLFATDAGGVGLNLQRAANACVLLELPWNPAVLEQRVGRIHRLGQTAPVDVYSLVSRGGIEDRICSLVADKRALFRGVFDGESDEVMFDRSGSFLGQLKRIVEPDELGAEVGDEAGDDADAGALADVGDDAGASEDTEMVDRASSDSDAAPEHEIEASATIAARSVADLAGPVAPSVEPRAPSSAPATGSDQDGAPFGREFARALANLRVERAPDGGLRIEAPRESAAALLALFESLTTALRDASERAKA